MLKTFSTRHFACVSVALVVRSNYFCSVIRRHEGRGGRKELTSLIRHMSVRVCDANTRKDDGGGLAFSLPPRSS